MIKLVTGAVQNPGGSVIPSGYLELTLSTDCSVIAPPGQVVAGTPIIFQFDSSGNLLGTCQIYSNAELNPAGSYYTVNILNSNKSRINQNPFVWVFSQAAGSTVDIGTIVPSSPSSPSYPGAVLLSPPAQQNGFININGILNVGANAAIGTSLAVGTNETVGGTLAVTGATTLAGVSATSLTTGQIIQPAATILTIKDNQGGTRLSIPAPGIAQTTINNALITGGSTYGGTTQHVQTFTGNGTFTIPANVASVKVTVVAGGGGGGGSTVSNNGGGGGSGSSAVKWLSALTSGNTLAVTIGAAGAAGLTNATGGTGGASSVASGTQTITSILTNGGAGGNGSLASSPGGGGGAASSGGDLNLDGSAGSLGFATNSLGGNGAGSILGGGAPNSGGVGVNGGAFGAGGGGAGGAANHSGGAGSAGVVIFEWIT